MKNKSLLIILIAFLSNFVFSQDDCSTSQNVADLTGTVCATATVSTTNFLAGGGCEEGINDTWFSFTAQGPTADITVSGVNRPEFLLVSSTTNDCNNFVLESCEDNNGNYSTITASFTGLTIGDIYYVVVSTNNDLTTGTISTCVDNPGVVANCVDNEDCTNAEVMTLDPSSAPGAVCVTDCNTGASAGNTYVGGGCEDQPNATVWYEFTTDASASTLDISLTSADLSDPEFTIIQGNACAAPFTIIQCTEGTAGNAATTDIPITASTTYVIGISDATADEGDFTLCVTQNPDNSACNTNNSLDVTATSLGSPLTGPFLPGEDVTFCYTVTDWQMINCNYIGAFVPSFGDGWDATSFDALGMPVNIGTPLNVNGVIQASPPGPPQPQDPCAGTASGSWNWTAANTVTYNVNGFYPINTPMPAGWYFLSSYSPTTSACAPDPTDPDFTYGDGDFPNCGTNTFDYNLCFTLTVKDIPACVSGETDLSVGIKTFSDGEFGAWNNLGCTADGTNTLANVIDCTVLPIELLEFNAQYINETAEISWSTASEENVSHFTLSHMSGNNSDLNEIAVIEAKGFSTDVNRYSFTHLQPHPGVNYYNLKAHDFDGKVQNHGYISIQADFNYAYFKEDSKEIVLTYPNEVEIYNMTGELILATEGATFIDFSYKGTFIIIDRKTGVVQKIVTY